MNREHSKPFSSEGTRDLDAWVAEVRKRARLKGYRWTSQRETVVRLFFSIWDHVTAESLYEYALEQGHSPGMTTIYRTLNMLVELGFARTLNFEDAVTRYEPHHLKPHHDHLICIECGKYIEFYHEELERLQLDIAEKNRFYLTHHRLDIFGLCPSCAARVKTSSR